MVKINLWKDICFFINTNIFYVEEKVEEPSDNSATEEHYLHPSLLSSTSQPVGFYHHKSIYFVIIISICTNSVKINVFIIQDLSFNVVNN